MIRFGFLFLTACLCLQTATPAHANIEITRVSPHYTSVNDMLTLLGTESEGGRHYLKWRDGSGEHFVEIRVHQSSNALLLSGAKNDVIVAEALIGELDLPPKQIVLEAQVIEVNRSLIQDLGIDWDGLWQTSSTTVMARLSDNTQETVANDDDGNRQTRDSYNRTYDLTSRAALAQFVRLLDEHGAGRLTSAPRVTTLNNKAARILDGQHVTYVTRASAYSNIYETQEMEAGLRLEVLPTLGQSGYLNLDITAELTQLTNTISGSPVKDGQIIDNHVVVRSGQSVVLGGFQKTVESKQTKRFPILGYVLPFLFSNEVRVDQAYDSVVILTANVVPLDNPLDGRAKRLLGSQGP